MITIFYSWQSNLNPKTNRDFIKTLLVELIDEFNKDSPNSYALEMDTLNENGFPDPLESILKKINESTIFVCDLTIINPDETTNKLKMPNANVMLELGYAISRLSLENVLCIYNKEYGDYKLLPSDIRNRIGISYSLKSTLEDIRKVKSDLKGKIKERIPKVDHVSYNIQLRDVKKILCDKKWLAIGDNHYLTEKLDMKKCWGEISINHLNDNHFKFEYNGFASNNKWWGELFLNKDFLRTGKIVWQSSAPDYGYKDIFIIDTGEYYHLFINPINFEPQTYGREILRREKISPNKI